VTGTGQLPQYIDDRPLSDEVVEGLGPHPGRERRIWLWPRRQLEKVTLACHRRIVTPIRSVGADARADA
jgi:hypothetical protein